MRYRARYSLYDHVGNFLGPEVYDFSCSCDDKVAIGTAINLKGVVATDSDRGCADVELNVVVERQTKRLVYYHFREFVTGVGELLSE